MCSKSLMQPICLCFLKLQYIWSLLSNSFDVVIHLIIYPVHMFLVNLSVDYVYITTGCIPTYTCQSFFLSFTISCCNGTISQLESVNVIRVFCIMIYLFEMIALLCNKIEYLLGHDISNPRIRFTLNLQNTS